MIKTQTSSQDITIREYSMTTMCDMWSRSLDSVFVSSKPVRRTLKRFSMPSCENSSEAPISQKNNTVVVSDQKINGWIAYIREEFYSIPQVEAIYVAIEENNIDLWLLIPTRDFTLLRRLVDREIKILESFAGTQRPPFTFEFHIVYRCGADESQFVPQRALRLTR